MHSQFDRPRDRKRSVVRISNAMTAERLGELAQNLTTCSPASFEANLRGFRNCAEAFADEQESARTWAAMSTS